MSEALRLADALEQQFPIGTAQHYLDGEAATELRRLHAENEALREANEAFGKRQEWWNDRMFEQEQRYMALVKAMADAKAMQMPLIHIDADVVQLRALDAELVEALRSLVSATEGVSINDYNEEAHDIAVSKARAALAKVEVSK